MAFLVGNIVITALDPVLDDIFLAALSFTSEVSHAAKAITTVLVVADEVALAACTLTEILLVIEVLVLQVVEAQGNVGIIAGDVSLVRYEPEEGRVQTARLLVGHGANSAHANHGRGELHNYYKY